MYDHHLHSPGLFTAEVAEERRGRIENAELRMVNSIHNSKFTIHYSPSPCGEDSPPEAQKKSRGDRSIGCRRSGEPDWWS